MRIKLQREEDEEDFLKILERLRVPSCANFELSMGVSRDRFVFAPGEWNQLLDYARLGYITKNHIGDGNDETTG